MTFQDSGKKEDVLGYPMASEDMKRVCLHCGQTYGEHSGEDCPNVYSPDEEEE